MGATCSSKSHVMEISVPQMKQVIKDKDVLERFLALRPHELYTDPEFFGETALYIDDHSRFNSTFNGQEIVWKRPSVLSSKPQLFVDGISRLDIVQGDLGDCWFLCACAAVTLKPEIWTKVIPEDNKYINHKGLYHFRFWRFGDWRDVYVDDLLPTVNGELVFAQASDRNEIWPSLIEKAYAKVNGSYQALQSGKASEALLDLTGGLTEVYYPPNMKGIQLYEVIQQAIHNGAFVACNTDSEHDGSRGLITGHAYSITKATSVQTRMGNQVDLLRIFNPWGGTEWTGDWSDLSETWNWLPENIRNELNVKKVVDGEFWMNFPDFQQQFSRVYICNLGPDFDMDGIVDKSKMISFHGNWIPGLSSGGCSDNLNKYSQNPQYTFSISQDNEIRNEEISQCFLIVSLMQKFERAFKHSDPALSEQYINFRIYRLSKPIRSRMTEEFFKTSYWTDPVLGEIDYTNTREVVSRFLLEPGHYLLVPSTFDPDVSASYLLRLFAWTQNFVCKEIL